MGHGAGKDVYRALGKKIDGLATRAPWNDKLRAILKELYTEEEADFVVKMPHGPSPLERVARTAGRSPDEVRSLLESLCDKGLVIDLSIRDTYYYQPSPLVIGIFEFTMMRTRGELNTKDWARLFHDYLEESDSFYEANDGQVSIMRALPHEQAVRPDDYSEILDHEKARSIVERANRWAVGVCSCRHEKHHLGKKKCDVPLGTCTTFGDAADYLVRHGLARDVSKEEMLEQVDRSWESGLVLNADNVQRNVTFICHCCRCCCNALAGVSRLGHPGVVVTSNFIAKPDYERCTACGNCARDCPIEAISMTPSSEKRFKKRGKPVVREEYCLGCGACSHRCKSDSLKLARRAQRVLHPETTFERVILQCLERGTLENQLFDNPTSKTQAFMRGLVGGFLRLPPVKRAIMTEALRSRFLKAMKYAARKRGPAELADL